MKKYDIIVIGSGCGLIVAEAASAKGWKTALIEKDYIGGTCLNVGCIPSKMLISPADIIYEISRSKRLGIEASINNIDFQNIITRAAFTIKGYRNKLHRSLLRLPGVDLFEGVAKFSADYIIEVAGETIQAERIVIACGTRPFIPDEALIGEEGFLTTDNLLELEQIPESIIIAGGGYVACEYAHFFSAMGSRVVVLEMADRLLSSEEPEISMLVEKTLKKVADIHTSEKIEKIEKSKSGWNVATSSVQSGAKNNFDASHVLLALGRRPNTDLLNIANTAIGIDDKGYVVVDKYLETNKPGIYAIGDVNGVQMFRHAANYEADIVFHNMANASSEEHKKVPVSYTAMPRAVFTRPQVAAVGLTEAEAKKHHKPISQITHFYETAKGEAIQERDGFIKVVFDEESRRILGCHIAGPQAPILIQEAVNAMTLDGKPDLIHRSVHIHPALSEVMSLAFSGV
jgi:mycothione reductase